MCFSVRFSQCQNALLPLSTHGFNVQDPERCRFSCVVFSVYQSIAQSCPTLCDPMDYSPPDSSVHWILQARILALGAIPFSRRSSWPRDWAQVSCTIDRLFTIWTTRGSLWTPGGRVPSSFFWPISGDLQHSLSLPALLDREPAGGGPPSLAHHCTWHAQASAS